MAERQRRSLKKVPWSKTEKNTGCRNRIDWYRYRLWERVCSLLFFTYNSSKKYIECLTSRHWFCICKSLLCKTLQVPSCESAKGTWTFLNPALTRQWRTPFTPLNQKVWDAARSSLEARAVGESRGLTKLNQYKDKQSIPRNHRLKLKCLSTQEQRLELLCSRRC